MTPKVGYFSLTFHKVMFFSTSSSIFQHFFGYTWSRLVEEREHRLDQDATLQKEQQKEKLEIATAGQREQKMMMRGKGKRKGRRALLKTWREK